MTSAAPRERATTLAAIATLAIALLVAACSQGEPQAKKSPAKPATASTPAPTQPAAAPAPDAGEIDAALKERLARQEAASRLFDRPTPPPEPAKPAPAAERAGARAPEPVGARTPEPVAARAPEPARSAEPAKPAEARKPETVVPRPEPAPAPIAVVPAPAASPPASAAPARTEPASRTEVAAAKPAARPAAEPTLARVVSRVEPEFPREAARAGEEQGLVKARLTLDANGNVTRVEIVESRPRRVFDREVVRALSQWKFNDGPSGRTYDTEVAFRR